MNVVGFVFVAVGVPVISPFAPTDRPSGIDVVLLQL